MRDAEGEDEGGGGVEHYGCGLKFYRFLGCVESG